MVKMSASTDPTADRIIQHLGLRRHPEGGWFTRTWLDEPPGGGRGRGSAIYYLLTGDERARWHRIDATEVWHLYAGAPLELRIVPEGGVARTVVLGPDLRAGQRPQALVPPRAWQRARSRGAYSLAGTTVCPAFDEDAFELAPPGWGPPASSICILSPQDGPLRWPGQERQPHDPR